MEIGSEFSTDSNISGINEFMDMEHFHKQYFLSGRTALYYIGQKLKNKVSHIIMPKYCCGSMIAPFVVQGYKITFYDSFKLSDDIANYPGQAILVMDYFGFLSDNTMQFISYCKALGKIVIVDATQVAFSDLSRYSQADYVVASYRKWLDCLCAAVYSKDEDRCEKYKKDNALYEFTWREAARLKKEYIYSSTGDKNTFLDMYSKAGRILDDDYIEYSADADEIAILCNTNSSYLIKKRRENASFLMAEIQQISKLYDVKLMFDEIGKNDCPLFVPVIFNEGRRDEIRKKLIENEIYCPVHWPIDRRYPYSVTEYHKCEMSLICDQRYGMDDMSRELEVLLYALRNYAE